MQTNTYFARQIHGGYKVLRLPNGSYEVDWPAGKVLYKSKRRTLIAITNRNPHPGPAAKDPKIGFNRYFKVNQSRVSGFDTLELFKPVEKAVDIIRGVDLENRGHEVAKLFYAGFARSVMGRGYDPQEVLQEVYKGILIRNKGKCPFDPRKSTFGHYVHMVIKCILANYLRRWDRVKNAEFVCLKSASGEDADLSDCSIGFTDADQEDITGWGLALRELEREAAIEAEDLDVDPSLTIKVAQAMSRGMKKAEIEKAISAGYRPYMIERAVAAVKNAAMRIRNYEFA
jgi:DNA-directed RNA polymerase specialized sigma24 family protein